MGVPGFFLWLSKKAKLLKLKEQLILKRIIDPEKVGDSLDCNAINSEKLDNLNYSKDIDLSLIHI